MGMLATVINALAIGDACKRANIDALVMSGFPIGGGVCDPVDHNKAKQALSMGKVHRYLSCVLDTRQMLPCP
jgi:uridylate kinase